MVGADFQHIFFPQWQGAVWSDLKTAAFAIKGGIDGVNWYEVAVPDFHSNLEKEAGIWGKSEILNQFVQARTLLDENKPKKLAVLGGGCDVDAMIVSYLNHVYKSDLQVLWLDAHADLNTPESSPSGAFHGMPVRLLFGEGDEDLMQLMFSQLRPNQVIFGGVRDVDTPEKSFMQSRGMVSLAVDDVTPHKVYSLLDVSKPLYIHLDLDVIDPEEFVCVACPTKSGVAFDQVKQSIDDLVERFNVVGMSLLECCHDKSSDSSELLSKLNFPKLLG
jgi:arginase